MRFENAAYQWILRFDEFGKRLAKNSGGFEHDLAQMNGLLCRKYRLHNVIDVASQFAV